MMLQELSPGGRLAFLLALSLAYATFSIRHQPPGLTRLLMSLPVILLFTSVMVAGSLGFLFGWLSNFKLLAFAANRGPLAVPGLTHWQWLLLLLLPCYPTKHGRSVARAGHVAAVVAGKVLLAAALSLVLTSPAGSTHSVLRHTGYALYVWVFASLVLDTPLPLGCRLLGGRLPLQPAMNNPFAATSVRQFWSQRYNLIVSAILRDTVYLPILEGCWMARPAGLHNSDERPSALNTTTASTTSPSTNTATSPSRVVELCCNEPTKWPPFTTPLATPSPHHPLAQAPL